MMTQEQKEAIKLLNSLSNLDEDQYFLLLSCIIKEPSVNNYYTPTPFEPLKVWYSKDSSGTEPYGSFGPVTSKVE